MKELLVGKDFLCGKYSGNDVVVRRRADLECYEYHSSGSSESKDVTYIAGYDNSAETKIAGTSIIVDDNLRIERFLLDGTEGKVVGRDQAYKYVSFDKLYSAIKEYWYDLFHSKTYNKLKDKDGGLSESEIEEKIQKIFLNKFADAYGFIDSEKLIKSGLQIGIYKPDEQANEDDRQRVFTLLHYLGITRIWVFNSEKQHKRYVGLKVFSKKIEVFDAVQSRRLSRDFAWVSVNKDKMAFVDGDIMQLATGDTFDLSSVTEEELNKMKENQRAVSKQMVKINMSMDSNYKCDVSADGVIVDLYPLEYSKRPKYYDELTLAVPTDYSIKALGSASIKGWSTTANLIISDNIEKIHKKAIGKGLGYKSINVEYSGDGKGAIASLANMCGQRRGKDATLTLSHITKLKNLKVFSGFENYTAKIILADGVFSDMKQSDFKDMDIGVVFDIFDKMTVRGQKFYSEEYKTEFDAYFQSDMLFENISEYYKSLRSELLKMDGLSDYRQKLVEICYDRRMTALKDVFDKINANEIF